MRDAFVLQWEIGIHVPQWTRWYFRFLRERGCCWRSREGGGVCLFQVSKTANSRRRFGVTDRHGPCRTPRPLMTVCFILFLEQQRHMLFFSWIRSVWSPLHCCFCRGGHILQWIRDFFSFSGLYYIFINNFFILRCAVSFEQKKQEEFADLDLKRKAEGKWQVLRRREDTCYLMGRMG